MPFGPHDPTCRRGAGQLWKAGRAPGGPVTLQHVRREGGVAARAWGPGAGWALARAEALAGLGDDPTAFEPTPATLATLARRGRGIRLPRSPWVFDGLTEYVLQQRVAFRDAARAHRRLVTALGAAAPGPPGLLLPLAPSDWLRLGSIDFRTAGVDGQRARALLAAARAARRVDSFAASSRSLSATLRLPAANPAGSRNARSNSASMPENVSVMQCGWSSSRCSATWGDVLLGAFSVANA